MSLGVLHMSVFSMVRDLDIDSFEVAQGVCTLSRVRQILPWRPFQMVAKGLSPVLSPYNLVKSKG